MHSCSVLCACLLLYKYVCPPWYVIGDYLRLPGAILCRNGTQTRPAPAPIVFFDVIRQRYAFFSFFFFHFQCNCIMHGDNQPTSKLSRSTKQQWIWNYFFTVLYVLMEVQYLFRKNNHNIRKKNQALCRFAFHPIVAARYISAAAFCRRFLPSYLSI